AEEETDALAAYFVETDAWDQLYRGNLDVIYGPKRSGKSALCAPCYLAQTNYSTVIFFWCREKNPAEHRPFETSLPILLRLNQSLQLCGNYILPHYCIASSLNTPSKPNQMRNSAKPSLERVLRNPTLPWLHASDV